MTCASAASAAAPCISLTDNLNTRHRNAQQAGRASIELYTLIYFYGKEVNADARVLQVHGGMGALCGSGRWCAQAQVYNSFHHSTVGLGCRAELID